jgi:hypothetical protein
VRLPLFNTGVDANGEVLAGGQVDPHYQLIQSAESSLPGPDAIVVSEIAEGYWMPNSSVSKWLAPSPNQPFPLQPSPCNATGLYTYRTEFDLSGFDPATVEVSGGWAADNAVRALSLNGVEVLQGSAGYAAFSLFTLSAGFVQGINTLDFQIEDLGCPNGFRAELSGTAQIQVGSEQL